MVDADFRRRCPFAP